MSSFEFTLNCNSWLLPYDIEMWLNALSEVGNKYPELSEFVLLGLYWLAPDKHKMIYYHLLIFIIAEESEIDVMDYGQNSLWYQILRQEILSL